MLLSIVVISHNKRDLLKRCVDSILAQALPIEYEIIISDDASADGSWELAQEYEKKFRQIRAYRCNSDDCKPANTSHRSGWNRCNAYKYAKGKYMAYVDGDDYLKEGSNIYFKQVELLEQHPDCSCCMANIWIANEGEPLERGHLRMRAANRFFSTGEILTAEDFIEQSAFVESHAFVYRRNEAVNPVELYGKRYVDEIITMHHLQFGSVICLDDWGYVYMHYTNHLQISSELGRADDCIVLWNMALYVSQLIPYWRKIYYRTHLKEILDVVRIAKSGYRLREDSYNSLQGLGLWIYSAFNRKLTIIDRARLDIIIKYVKFLKRNKIRSDCAMNLLFVML